MRKRHTTCIQSRAVSHFSDKRGWRTLMPPKERQLPESKLVAPTYIENFRCIGPACEDTCCKGWAVPVSRSAYEKYQTLGPGPLRTLIDASILLAPKDAAGSEGYGPEAFAKIQMNESNACPILTTEGLCQIHAQLGPGFLSTMCATYPRILRSVGGVEQNALALSCPEAARNVLLNPIVWKQVETATSAAGQEHPQSFPISSAQAIRATVLDLAINPAHPLWQRLLYLGVLCQRLDALSCGWPEEEVLKCLNDFNRAVAAGTLHPIVDALPIDPRAHMDAVLRLAGLMLHKSNVTARFVECINAFTAGIGNGPDATLETLTAGYQAAHDRFFAPLFERHPHILENYLINTILRCEFPFGRAGRTPGMSLSATREFTALVAQFSLTKGLLVGVAGFHRENFSTEHVVHTIQASSKHFDHHPEFPKLACELLVETRLADLNGAAVLLRDKKSDRHATRTVSLSNLYPAPMLQTAISA